MGPNTKLPTRNEIGAAHSVVMIARAQMGHPDPLIATSFHSDPDAIQQIGRVFAMPVTTVNTV
jgi:hypothetical protein